MTVSELATWLHQVFIKQFDAWILLGFVAQFFSPCASSCNGSPRKGPSAQSCRWPSGSFRCSAAACCSVYAIQRQDPVFIAGQAMGMFIYIRNLWLIANERKAAMGPKVD